MTDTKSSLSDIFLKEVQFPTRSQHEQFRQWCNQSNQTVKLRRIDVFYEQEWTSAVEEVPVLGSETNRITIIAWNLKDYFDKARPDGRALHWFYPVFTLPQNSQLIAPIHLYTDVGEDDPSYESSDDCDLEYKDGELWQK